MNLLFNVLALTVALPTIFYGVRSSSDEALGWGAFGKALGIAFATTIAVSVLGLVFGADIFGLVHIWYLILTVAIPLTALAVLIRADLDSGVARVLMACLVLAPVGLYASYVEPFWLKTDQVNLELAEGGEEIRIGVLADLQTIEIGDYENRATRALLDTEPDIVVIPGDFWQMPLVDFEAKKPEFAQLLQDISAEVEHVFAVSGNTDNVPAFRELAENTTVRVLDGEIEELEINGRRVAVGGVTLFDNDGPNQDAVEALADMESESLLTILVGHKPDERYRLPSGRQVDLMIAGHTHGGQFSIPFIGPLATASSAPHSVARGGLNDFDGQAMYVSTGVGRERGQAPQMRFGVRPSIGVIDVVDASATRQ